MAAVGFNTADYFIIGIVGFSAVVSLARGFVREALSLAVWIVSIYVAMRYAGQFSDLAKPYIHTPSLQFIATAVVILILMLIIGTLIVQVIVKLVEKTGLSGLDRVLGIVFGLARGILLVGVLLLALRLTPFPQDAWWKESMLIPQFEPLEVWLKSLVPTSVNDQFEFHAG